MTILEQIAPLFDGWEETMVWSCLQGVMGRAEANADGTAACGALPCEKLGYHGGSRITAYWVKK